MQITVTVIVVIDCCCVWSSSIFFFSFSFFCLGVGLPLIVLLMTLYCSVTLQLLMSNRSPLVELNILKKICDHPRLLSTLACEQLGLDEEDR